MVEHLYILGHPVAHSKSPDIYNAIYPKLGLPWEYGFQDIADEGEARAFIEARRFLSLNVTTPWKPLAFRAADVAAATAKLAGGANVLVRKDTALLAYNVDGQGCVRYLERAGARFGGAAVALCGTGPTAISIMHECAQAGCASVLMLSRDRVRSQQVVNGYLDAYRELLSTAITLPGAPQGRVPFAQAYQDTEFLFGSYATSTAAIANADIIIDATPLGMRPGDPAPFDTALISEAQLVFDTVYGHGQTALLRAAQQAGARALDGRGMLVAQAVETAGIVCDVCEVPMPLSDDELFAMMADAAGFDL